MNTKAMLETLNEITLLVDEPLKNVTFTKTGGPADVLALPKTKKEVEEIVAYCREQGLSWLVLGNASNLIVRDGGIRDVVIMLTEMKEIKVAGTTMVVDAGAKLIDTTYEALAADLTGFEFACGIPGSVGGAVYMNAGAYGGEIKDV
ncbi:FAD-binding protein, partial [Enterococcus faecalis]|nr:FAD-binding protein [Enterococcus faecalis]